MKKIFFIIVILFSFKSFTGDTMSGGGGGWDKMISPHFSSFLGIEGGGGGGSQNPFMASHRSNYWKKPINISNRIGDFTGIGGRYDSLDPKNTNLSGLGVGVADGGGGWDELKDPKFVYKPMSNKEFENGISGGIIGTLSGASAE